MRNFLIVFSFVSFMLAFVVFAHAVIWTVGDAVTEKVESSETTTVAVTAQAEEAEQPCTCPNCENNG